MHEHPHAHAPGEPHHHGDHDHSHAPSVTASNERRIRLVFLMTAGYAAVQAVGGVLSGSLALIADRDPLPPLLGQQIAFFTQKAAESKRFFCRPCGMRRNSIFSFCPRCRAWHSVSFRLYLN